MSKINIDAIRARAKAATPGPWWWSGERSMQQVTLDANHRRWGRVEVMSFRRWGMQHAKPVFSDHDKCLILTDTEDRLIYQVCPEATTHKDPRVYRQTIAGIRHPDAEFIAHSRQDVEDLLAYIDELEDQLNGIALEEQW